MMSNATSLGPAKFAGRAPLVRARGRARALRGGLALLLVLASVGASLAADPPPSLSGVVNLNTATSEELQMLPGVGEVRADAIVSTRKNKGGFKTIDELVEVKGVGPALLERLRPYLSVKGKTTVKRL